MKKRIIIAGLLLAAAVVMPASSVSATIAYPYYPAPYMPVPTSPYAVALAAQANQAASAANSQAIAAQQQANQAALLAAAANQTAYNKQAEANIAAINAAAANQAACNMIILSNPVLSAPVVKPCPVDPRARNLELLHNINTIDQARIAATNARATANMTLTRLNDVNALRNATKAEVVKNPGLTQRLNELTAISNSLQSQFDQQNKDASAKEENFRRLQATLPTAGYNPAYWKCYY